MPNENKGDTPLVLEVKVISKKSYLIELLSYDDGSTSMNRVNDGFDTIQLLGLLSFTKDELHSFIKGEPLEINRVNRTVIKQA